MSSKQNRNLQNRQYSFKRASPVWKVKCQMNIAFLRIILYEMNSSVSDVC